MRPRRWSALLLGFALVTASVYYATQRWQYAQRYVTTDNAQSDGIFIPIRARSSGTIDSVGVSENAPVHRGDLLIQFRDLEATQRIIEAQAEYAALMFAAGKGTGNQAGPGLLDSQARAATAETDAAQASIRQLQSTLANASSDYERVTRLAAQKMATTESLEAARTRVEALKHGLEAARSHSQASYEGALAQKAQWKTQDFKIDAAHAKLVIAKERWGDMRLAAPRDGVVSKKAAEPGQYVVAGQQLMSLTSLDGIWVVANLKETDVGRVRIGQASRVTFDAYPGRVLEGVVQSMGPATGAKFSLLPQENATGNFTKVVQRVPVKVVLTRGDTVNGLVLRPGLSAFVEIRTDGS